MQSVVSCPLAEFALSLAGDDVVARLRAGLIGEGLPVPGPFGEHPLVYADYVASGRALKQIETFIAERVLPYYANSHTEASFCGAFMTRMRNEARRQISRLCGAGDGFATVFCGSGATAGINRLVHLFGLPEAVNKGVRPLVVVGPYEHHSNILPWRESGAEVIEITEADHGGPDIDQLEQVLCDAGENRIIVGAFSAASNVTGIVTDTDYITKILKKYKALAVWDYAGGGPYLPIDMREGTDCEKDAVVVSTHKFIGGPGASGVMIVRTAAVIREKPVITGGGTVRFVSPWGHDYSSNLATREEAGTPNVIGDIRAALCFIVKEAIGQEFMEKRNRELRERVENAWRKVSDIKIVGNRRAKSYLPIFSFVVTNPENGQLIHQQLFTRMLSDFYGIQVRGGCACAGPYAHRVLGIDQSESVQLRQAIMNGEEIEKPGWTRMNFSVLMDNSKVDMIIASVIQLVEKAASLSKLYDCDQRTARFRPKLDKVPELA